MAQTSTKSPRDAGSDNDAIAGLHRMSTTAGAGSQEYVAINGTAITAAFFGVASLLSLMGNVLLVIPLVGVICGFVALGQIRNSGETQTGRFLAWGGIVLSLLIGGWVIGSQIVEASRARQDKVQIAELIGRLGSEIRSENWDGAYGLFTRGFQQRVGKELFAQRLRQAMGNEVIGALQRTDGNNLVEFEYVPGVDPRATAYIRFYFEKAAAPADQLGRFRKIDGQWRIEDVGELFAIQEAGPAGPR